jgi:hypothetical protein
MDGIPCGAIFGEQAEVLAVDRHSGLDPESSFGRACETVQSGIPAFAGMKG